MKSLEIKNLQVSFRTYQGIITPVRDVSFYVEPHSIVAIIGESGSGKTVTAHAILQLLPRETAMIAKGNISFNGEELTQKSEREMELIRGAQIGMIFQDPMTSLNPTMRIGQQITESIIKHRQLSRADAHREAIELLQLVKMPQAETRMTCFPHELSGGMIQRVMIAIALAGNPSILIADEPTTALDVTTQAQILQLLKDIQKQREMSILFITHDLAVVAELCDRVVVMYGGTVVEQGNVKEVFSNPLHPYTAALLKAIPRLNGDSRLPLIPIEGSPPSPAELGPHCPFLERCPHSLHICELHHPPNYVADTHHRVACWQQHPIPVGGEINDPTA